MPLVAQVSVPDYAPHRGQLQMAELPSQNLPSEEQNLKQLLETALLQEV